MHGASSSSANPSGVRGICPSGWHVPSNAELTELENYVGSVSSYQCNGNSSNIAKALASTSGWTTNSSTCAVGNNQNSNNSTGFNAYPAGYFTSDGGSCISSGTVANFWTATMYSSTHAKHYHLNHDHTTLDVNSSGKALGLSVRCIRNE